MKKVGINLIILNYYITFMYKNILESESEMSYEKKIYYIKNINPDFYLFS